MFRPELIRVIARKAGLSIKDARKAQLAFEETLQETLAKGEEVNLIGHGKYSTVLLRERKGRNPQTKQEISIKPSRSIRFKVGKTLKDRVNGKI